MKFCFGDIVVVEKELIGVVVKSWLPPLNKENGQCSYEVYVRCFNEIRDYKEDEIERYMVRHKYLSEEELQWQYNAINNSFLGDRGE